MNLCVLGMRRSGNHAVIAWARRAMPASVFLNDCGAGDPYESFQMLETPQGERHGPSFRETRWFPQFPAARDTRPHVVSYEDLPIGDLPASGLPASDLKASDLPASGLPASGLPASGLPASALPRRAPPEPIPPGGGWASGATSGGDPAGRLASGRGDDAQTAHGGAGDTRSPTAPPEPERPGQTRLPGFAAPFRVIVVVRGFANWLASYLTLTTARETHPAYRLAPAQIPAKLAVWAGHATQRGVTRILYDHWRTDPAYRRALLGDLGLGTPDPGLGETQGYGGGATFAHGDPGDRWRRMAHDRDYLALARHALSDPHITRAIRAVCPEDEALIRRLIDR